MAGLIVRPGGPGDLEAVARIQEASPGAAHWQPADYLLYDFLVALCEDRVIGFAVARRVSGDEAEILNLAVDPERRRWGVARRLVSEIRIKYHGDLFLEVRESNLAARKFYETVGFTQAGARVGYYNNPVETAIVMKFHSC